MPGKAASSLTTPDFSASFREVSSTASTRLLNSIKLLALLLVFGPQSLILNLRPEVCSLLSQAIKAVKRSAKQDDREESEES